MSSSDWIQQYCAALDARDAREQAHKPYVDAYTKLADRTASQESRPNPGESGSSRLPARREAAAAPQPDENAADLLARLRADLGITQRARTALQAQVDELTTTISSLELQAQVSAAQGTQLSRQRVELERRLRDRDEELRGKSRLVTLAQDEMVAQGLQLHMAEQKAERLEQDNRELLDRWMKSKGAEADKMNTESDWK